MEFDIFSFVHFSDLHLPDNKEKTKSGIKPYKKLNDTINSITQLEPKPRFAIITGDLIEKGATQGYKNLEPYLQKLEKNNIPALCTIGNHDDRDAYREAYHLEGNGPIFHISEFDGYRIICLDSKNPGSELGYLTGNQLDWLQNVLMENQKQPTIIAAHHPINPPRLDVFNKEFDASQREQFYDIISSYNVLAILNGHLHQNMVTIVNGLLHVQASCINSELAVNENEYLLLNTASYNQILIKNKIVYVKTHSLPYDGRVLGRGSIQALIESRR